MTITIIDLMFKIGITAAMVGLLFVVTALVIGLWRNLP